MNPIPFIPDNAPFSPEQRLWLNGYLAGLFSDATLASKALAGLSAAPAAPPKPLVVLYGSQTGTSEGLARKASREAAKRGFEAKLVPMDKYESVDLSKEERALVITSTYGDGDPPDNALSFWNYLSSEAAPKLDHLNYSVLALGDTNYAAFCEFGKKCDARLEALGAKRVHPRQDCDVDYDAPAAAWTESVFAALSSGAEAAVPSAASTKGAAATTEAPQGYSRKNPFPARLLVNRKLTGEGSAKEVRHFEISLAESGLSYEVGDALGVVPANCQALVSDLLEALGCDGEEAVKTPDGAETSLRIALTQHYDITRPSSDLLKAAAGRSAQGELSALLDPASNGELKKWLWGREIIDVLHSMTTKFEADELVTFLKKLQPRLYSISSSPKAHPDEVHLTIGAVRYDAYGRARKGVCSTFLADRCADGTPVPVFVQTAHGFRLPPSGDVPVIMCGPGTGIAPFRAFLEERLATGAPGRNWLFFGDQRQATDFLYQETLEGWQATGHLARLDLAFSRDQTEKIYVQHRMLENAAELWAWFQDGAHFYVCGDASRMAKDVDAALHQIAERAGGLSKEAAAEYVAKLKSDKRYQRDVY
ncbi:MAG: sulfite reductase flavoprotein alpha-component [Chthoniobacter sp.]|jgi:sulfite reductase (NADPH) flavoprotein alpha-component|nr:sulfite reductase flavoprotein alpha-component [Chthoniobacter sp.]